MPIALDSYRHNCDLVSFGRACLTVGAARRQLAKSLKEKGQRAANGIGKWDADAGMERYEAERLSEVKPMSQD
ncbi:MAG: hypothetical protein KC439_13780 [Yoonia sp.]|nr:hypothetical protein [Yoonia sp.]